MIIQINKFLLVFGLLFVSSLINGQENFSRLDSLRGSITPEREWWDLNYYHLDIAVDPERKFISGKVNIQYTVLSSSTNLQLDLQDPLDITKIEQDGKRLSYTRFGPVYSIQLKKKQVIGKVEELIVYYEGQPIEARRAPWDGGISWKKDKNGNPFIASSCQGIGASIWWPCKDHMYDEVDSMHISIEVPSNLVGISNGRLIGVDENKKRNTKTYHWFVSNPINNYGVSINIGDYINWREEYIGEKGELDLDFWVLSYNEDTAKTHFEQAAKAIEAFEYWFGPYPFYEDSYKLVEAPFVGMEHQSSVAYGNKFQNGYLGMDRSGTEWDMEFDYIIIHESGHEWFANNISYKDVADMWIHESFTCYSESLYIEYWFGKDAGEEYNRGLRDKIGNKETMIGSYGVNSRGSDLYNKGANVLGMIRQIMDDDEKWRSILRGLNGEFYHQTVSTEQIENFISEGAEMDFSSLFDQYLRDTRIPILEYYFLDGNVVYRWTNVVDGFSIPVDVYIGEDRVRLTPNDNWQRFSTKEQELKVQPNYYIETMKSRR